MADEVDTVESPVWEPITLDDGTEARKYPDGSIRNERGHMVVPLPGKHTITQADASTLANKRRELKYQRAQAGANRALAALRDREYDEKTKKWVDVGPKWENPQDLDYVEAIAEAQTAQALLVGDPSSTKAAEWVMRHTGQDERQAREDGSESTADGVRRLIADLAAIARRVEAEEQKSADIVDGSTIPSQLPGAENDG